MKPYTNPASSGKITTNLPSSTDKNAQMSANAYLKPPKVKFYKNRI